MSLADVTDSDAVLRALDEFDSLGREEFLSKYGFGPSRRFFLSVREGLYDSKAILGAAHGYQLPQIGPLSHNEFSGGTPTVRKLMDLGFEVLDVTQTTTESGRIFGEIPGFPEGSIFRDRDELAESGVHRPPQSGISGGQDEGADSVVVSGGYEDDLDFGDRIVYTGHGGNDPQTKRQVRDQEFSRGNRALAVSCDQGLPVRVVRGQGGDPAHSPSGGFRYDGLFSVQRYWHETGLSGFRVYRFELVASEDPISRESEPGDEDAGPTERVQTTIQRLVRSTTVTRRVKSWHEHRCQICGEALETPAGRYSEGAHIRPLGRPHDGLDVVANVLCLCPNHHVLLDSGSIYVDEELRVRSVADGGLIAPLRVHPEHMASMAALEYHRQHIADLNP